MIDAFEWTDLLFALPVLVALVYSLIKPRHHKEPPYLGPWPWQLSSGFASLTIILSHVSFLVTVSYLLGHSLIDDDWPSYSFFLTASWLLLISAVIYQYLVIARRPEPDVVSNKSAPAAFNEAVASINSTLSTSGDFPPTSVSVCWAQDSGPTIELRRPRRGQFSVIIRHLFHDFCTIASDKSLPIHTFLKFILLHEVAHHLNGDIKTARIVNLTMMCGGLFIFLSIPLSVVTAASLIFSSDPFPQTVVLSICIAAWIVYGASLSAFKRFSTEREKRADLRARFGLTNEEQQELFEDESHIQILLELYALFRYSHSNLSSRKLPVIRVPFWLLSRDLMTGARVDSIRSVRLTPRIRDTALNGAMFGFFIGTLFSISFIILFTILIDSHISADIYARIVITIAAMIGTPSSAYAMTVSSPLRIPSFAFRPTSVLPATVLALTMTLGAIAAVTIFVVLGAVVAAVSPTPISVITSHTYFIKLIVSLVILGCVFGLMVGRPFWDFDVRYWGAVDPFWTKPMAFLIGGVSGVVTITLIIFLCGSGSQLISYIVFGLLASLTVCATCLLFDGLLPNKFRIFLPLGLQELDPPLFEIRVLWRRFFVDWTWRPRKYLLIASPLIALQIVLSGAAVYAFITMVSSFEWALGHISPLYWLFYILCIFLTIAILAYFCARLRGRPTGHHSVDDEFQLAVSLCQIADDPHDDELSNEARRLADRIAALLEDERVWRTLMPTAASPELVRRLLYAVRLRKLYSKKVSCCVSHQIADALQDIFRDDRTVGAWSNGPSDLRWTSIAAVLAIETGIEDRIGLTDLIASITRQSEETIRAYQSPFPGVRSVRNRNLFWASYALNVLGEERGAKRIAGFVVDSLNVTDVNRSGLSPSQLVECIFLADNVASEVQLAIANALSKTTWFLSQTNFRLRVMPSLDCIQAAKSMMRFFPHVAFSEVDIRHLLSLILKHDS